MMNFENDNGCNMKNGLRIHKNYNMYWWCTVYCYFLVNVSGVKGIIDEFGVCNVNVLSSFTHC